MGSETILVGTASDVSGEELRVMRSPDGFVMVGGSRGTALGFEPDQLAGFRELLDRAAMPGQDGGAVS